MLFAHTPIARLARRLWADRASWQRERLINTRPKRDLCKQEQLEVGAAKWERAASKEGVGTVAFSVAFILTLRRKVISVIVTRLDNICNNLLRLTRVLWAFSRISSGLTDRGPPHWHYY